MSKLSKSVSAPVEGLLRILPNDRVRELKRPGVACVCLLLKGRAKWTEGERQVSQAVLNAGQVIEPGFGWVKSSRQAIKGRAETKLEARLEGTNHWMFGRVFIWRRTAAADAPARETQAQMQASGLRCATSLHSLARWASRPECDPEACRGLSSFLD